MPVCLQVTHSTYCHFLPALCPHVLNCGIACTIGNTTVFFSEQEKTMCAASSIHEVQLADCQEEGGGGTVYV